MRHYCEPARGSPSRSPSRCGWRRGSRSGGRSPCRCRAWGTRSASPATPAAGNSAPSRTRASCPSSVTPGGGRSSPSSTSRIPRTRSSRRGARGSAGLAFRPPVAVAIGPPRTRHPPDSYGLEVSMRITHQRRPRRRRCSRGRVHSPISRGDVRLGRGRVGPADRMCAAPPPATLHVPKVLRQPFALRWWGSSRLRRRGQHLRAWESTQAKSGPRASGDWSHPRARDPPSEHLPRKVWPEPSLSRRVHYGPVVRGVTEPVFQATGRAYWVHYGMVRAATPSGIQAPSGRRGSRLPSPGRLAGGRSRGGSRADRRGVRDHSPPGSLRIGRHLAPPAWEADRGGAAGFTTGESKSCTSSGVRGLSRATKGRPSSGRRACRFMRPDSEPVKGAEPPQRRIEAIWNGWPLTRSPGCA